MSYLETFKEQAEFWMSDHYTNSDDLITFERKDGTAIRIMCKDLPKRIKELEAVEACQ